MKVKGIYLIENPSILFCHQIQYKLKLHVSPCAYIVIVKGELINLGLSLFLQLRRQEYICGTNFRDVINRTVSYIDIIVVLKLTWVELTPCESS